MGLRDGVTLASRVVCVNGSSGPVAALHRGVEGFDSEVVEVEPEFLHGMREEVRGEELWTTRQANPVSAIAAQ